MKVQKQSDKSRFLEKWLVLIKMKKDLGSNMYRGAMDTYSWGKINANKIEYIIIHCLTE